MSGTTEYICRQPDPGIPAIDLETGQFSRSWWNWTLQIYRRTGDQQGVGSAEVQTTANGAQTDATAAQATATSAQTTANAAVVAAAGAQSTANAAATATAAETTRALAAEALLAPKASPSFTGSIEVGNGAASVGFYGTAPITKQSGVPVTAAGIHAALTALGLIAP